MHFILDYVLTASAEDIAVRPEIASSFLAPEI
jgi:hypothetical protein